MAKKEQLNYRLAKQQLIELLDWFESGDPDLDKALENYKTAQTLIKQIEEYLTNTEQELKISMNKS